MSRKEHLTAEGLRAIVLLKAALNQGLSENLQTAFQVTSTEVEKGFLNKATAYLCNNVLPFHPQWLAGFTSGDGNFAVGLYSNSVRLGLTPRLLFQLTQHSRDDSGRHPGWWLEVGGAFATPSELLIRLCTWLGCGTVRKVSQSSVVIFSVQKFCGGAEKMKVKSYLSSGKILSKVLKLTTSMIDVGWLKLYGQKVT